MCDKCNDLLGEDPDFDPRDPNVKVETVFGIPIIRNTFPVDGGHGHVIAVPNGVEIPANVKAMNDRRLGEMLDSVDRMTREKNEDAAFLAIMMTLADELPGDPHEARSTGMIIATLAIEAAKLRREVRTHSEGLFGPQGTTQAPRTAPQADGWNPPPPWI